MQGEVAAPERKSFGKLMLGEALCGLAAAGSVAPAIAIVDQSIFSNASGRERMLACVLRQTGIMLRQPLTFFRQPAVLWIYAVYGSTYVVANCGETLYKHLQPGESVELPKFLMTSATNVGASTVKDRAFANIFAAVGQAPRPVPRMALGMFAVRDTITVGSSFTLVPYVSRLLVDTFGWSSSSSLVTAQLFTPCAAQLINTPFYLYGLSLHNSPTHSMAERRAFIGREYTKTFVARCGRIFPAFGIGGVLNRKMRKKLHESMK